MIVSIQTMEAYMQFWVYRNHILFTDKENEKYHLISENENTPIIVKATFGEILQEIRSVAIAHCKQKNKIFRLSFQVPESEGNIVLNRNQPPYFRQALSAEEQLNVWEILKDVPYHN